MHKTVNNRLSFEDEFFLQSPKEAKETKIIIFTFAHHPFNMGKGWSGSVCECECGCVYEHVLVCMCACVCVCKGVRRVAASPYFLTSWSGFVSGQNFSSVSKCLIMKTAGAP